MSKKKKDANGYRQFGAIDKWAYAAGDFGCNMSFALKGTLTIFWTQFMGIDQLVMASLLLIVQVWDAINDPLIGTMIDADRHQYKRNKFLQYIHIGSIGLLFAGAACFLPFPGAPAMAKNILFVAGYILWDAFYTIANVPYGSMLSLISNDAGDRAVLSTFRSLGSMIANIGSGVLLPILIYNADNELMGNRVFIIAFLMGVIGFIAFQFMVRNTVIRVEQNITLKEDTPKFNVFEACGRFFKNRAAVGATLAPVGMFIGMYGAGTANTIMWQSYFKNAQISGLMGMISYIPMFFFMPFIRKIVDKFGKKEAVTVGTIATCIGYGLLLVLPITPDTKGIAMWVVGQLIAGFGAGIGTCVSWSLMADAMDYGEWKFGVREEGTTYALHSFFRKLAQGIGPSLGLVLATALGYNATLGAAQLPEVASNMRLLTAGAYFVSGLIQLISYAFIYNLDRKTLATVQSDLEARKKH